MSTSRTKRDVPAQVWMTLIDVGQAVSQARSSGEQVGGNWLVSLATVVHLQSIFSPPSSRCLRGRNKRNCCLDIEGSILYPFPLEGVQAHGSVQAAENVPLCNSGERHTNWSTSVSRTITFCSTSIASYSPLGIASTELRTVSPMASKASRVIVAKAFILDEL